MRALSDSVGYRFEPLSRRGLLLGLGPAQLAVVVAALAAAVGLVKSWPGLGGAAAATAVLAAAAALCRPVAGRPPLQWLGLGVLFAGRSRRQVMAPPAGGRGNLEPQPWHFPARTFAVGVYLDQVAAAAGQGPIGVLVDRRAGTAAALLRARGGPFCLVDGADKERKLATWAGTLEAVANQRSSVVRLQWCQRARPADAEALLSHLSWTGDRSSPGYDGHLALLGAAGPRAWRHETFLAVTVRAPARRRHLEPHLEMVVRNEIRALRAQLRNAGIVCDGVLDGAGVATAIGSFLVPGLDRHPGAHPWPLALEERWSDLHAEGHWYRTYWVAEWPRSAVAPDFLSPLLIGRGRRSFAVAMAPVPPERAARDAESARTAHLADAQLRAQGGFLETAQHRRQAEAVEGRETQLAEGRGAFQFSGYVAVAAEDEAGLSQACADLERAAGAARLCLRPLYGQQRDALTWALPFGRGV